MNDQNPWFPSIQPGMLRSHSPLLNCKRNNCSLDSTESHHPMGSMIIIYHPPLSRATPEHRALGGSFAPRIACPPTYRVMTANERQDIARRTLNRASFPARSEQNSHGRTAVLRLQQRRAAPAAGGAVVGAGRAAGGARQRVRKILDFFGLLDNQPPMSLTLAVTSSKGWLDVVDRCCSLGPFRHRAASPRQVRLNGKRPHALRQCHRRRQEQCVDACIQTWPFVHHAPAA